jgi:hypothetical protein
MKTDVLRKGLQLYLIIRWVYVPEEELRIRETKTVKQGQNLAKTYIFTVLLFEVFLCFLILE